MNNIILRLKKMPRWTWILLAIIVVGIFFRTYHFRDWLQFSPDEARDATYIGNAITGKAKLPELGPQAGNTKFYLGPLYYQMEYAAALIFGNTPEKIAYPDLFFSILAIPMLFVFLRRYFSLSVSLALDALLSFSYFAIEISRFASNPNSIPFFVLVFLYGLLEMLENKKQIKPIWPIMVGIGLGVGIQLHALLFLIMPTVALLVCIYLLKNKKLTWLNFVLVLVFFLLANFGQLSYELRTNGSNVKQLFKGASSESSGGGASTLVRNVGLISACQIQANAKIVSSVVNVENCGGLFELGKATKKSKDVPGGALGAGLVLTLAMLASLIFSVGGYALAGYYLKKETDNSRRNFLLLFLVFNVVSFVVLIPVASQVSVRYFNILFFVPFVLLGLWFDFIFEKFKKHAQIACVTIIGLLLLGHSVVLARTANVYLTNNGNDVDNSYLGETQTMLGYLIQNSPEKNIYLDGSTFYLKRFLKPFVYLVATKDVNIITPASKQTFASGTQFFYIDGTPTKNLKIGDQIKGDTILKVEKFQKITIYTLRKQ